MPDRQPHAQASQRAGLGQGLGDQQVGITVNQGDGRFGAKIDIGLINHHNRVRVGIEDLLDLLQPQRHAGRCVRVGEDDAAIGLAVVRRVDAEIVTQRLRSGLDTVQAAVHRVEAVGNVRVQHRPTMLEQPVKDVRQHFIRAVTNKHLRGIHAVVAGNLVFQRIGIRRRIQTQAVIEFRLNGIHHPRRRPIGILVGIELDQVLDLGLLTRHIGHQVVDKGTPETTHGTLQKPAEG